MSDFLTRLAGRALRQIPVLEPLAPSWTTPLAVAPETEEVEAQVQHGVWPAAVAMPQDAAAVEAPPLPDWPPMRSTLNLGLPGRVTTGLVEVEAVVPAPPQVVAAPAPAVAQRRTAAGYGFRHDSPDGPPRTAGRRYAHAVDCVRRSARRGDAGRTCCAPTACRGGDSATTDHQRQHRPHRCPCRAACTAHRITRGDAAKGPTRIAGHIPG